MILRPTAVLFGLIATFALVNCAQHSSNSDTKTVALDVQHLRAEATRLRERPQQSTAVHTPSGQGWWYFEHPKDLAAGVAFCDSAHAKLAVPAISGNRLYDCDAIVQGKAYAFQQNIVELENTVRKCRSQRDAHILFSECSAARLAERDRER